MEPEPPSPSSFYAFYHGDEPSAESPEVVPPPPDGRRSQAAPSRPRYMGIAAPERPQSARAGPARPQSCRFLQETLVKLSEDCMRCGSTSPPPYRELRSPSPPPPPSHSPTPAPARRQLPPAAERQSGATAAIEVDAYLEARLEQWRELFHEEVRDCIADLRTAVNEAYDANVAHFATQFAAWRKADIKVTAQMRQHADELMAQSREAQNFYFKYLAAGEFDQFRHSIADLTKSVEELAKERQEPDERLIAVCAAAVEKALDAGAGMSEVEVKSAGTGSGGKNSRPSSAIRGLGSFMDQETARWEEDAARWSGLDARLCQVTERIRRLDEAMARSDVQSEVEALPVQVAQKLSPMIRDAVGEITRTSREEADALRRSTGSDGEAMRKRVEELISGALAGGGSGGLPTLIAAQLEPLASQLQSLVAIQAQTEHWEGAADEWKRKAEEARTELERSLGEAKAAESRCASLSQAESALQGEVQELRRSLDKASLAPGGLALRKITSVESKGNVRLNLRSGDMELLRPVDFIQNKPNEAPDAELKQPELAVEVLQDVAKLASLFEVPVSVESHAATAKGGAPAFWEEVVGNRASFMKAQLEQHGVKPELVTAKGLYGKKGLNKACVIIRLDSPGHFAGEKMPAAAAVSAEKASPRGKR